MKTGLVVEGGGMKCAYSAGILDRFLDEHITFDYCIGVSAGSANVASYLAGQRGRNLRFYVDHLHEPGYMGVKNPFWKYRWKYLGQSVLQKRREPFEMLFHMVAGGRCEGME